MRYERVTGSAHTIRAIATTFVVLVGAATAGPPNPALTVSGDRLAVGGTPKFLVLISYFDALHASAEALDSDLRYFHDNGIDGIRIFPNWWDYGAGMKFARDTLMDAAGGVRPERLAALVRVLNRAALYDLIVDVSFAYETVEGLSALRRDQVGVGQGELPVNQVRIDAYEVGLVQVAAHLGAYRHVFFDIQNEYNGRITHLSDDEVRRLCAAVRKADPDRLVTASLANEIGPEDVARRSDETGVDIVGWHESRNPWQFDTMDALVQRTKGVTSKPVYLGEPAVLDEGLTVENFLAAVTNAKAGGAAAWTFHTHSGFDLAREPMAESLTEQERLFIESFRARVDATKWGATAPRSGDE